MSSLETTDSMLFPFVISFKYNLLFSSIEKIFPLFKLCIIPFLYPQVNIILLFNLKYFSILLP